VAVVKSKNGAKNIVWYLVIVLAVYAAYWMLFVAFAQKTSAATSDLSRSFGSSEKIEPGSLVSLVQNKDGYVEPTNTGNSEQLVGVAVVTDNSLLAVNVGNNKAQVAISGQATTIVSNLNGDISPGDLIGATAFSGVGAKALPGDRVVGVAQASFGGDDAGTKSITVTDTKGKSKEIKLGSIQVVISVGTKAGDSSPYGVGNGLQGFATNIAGKPVSLVRIALCLIIGLVAIISLVVVVYSTIRNGISAVARNPLAKPAIFDTMAQVMVMIAFIAVVSIVMMYAVLRI
jgi:F0F1-type ATP synthase membrane subunit c/vacuolar-type H+-ATPase subunit K